MYPLLMECVTEFRNHLKYYANEEKQINLKEMCANFSMDVIAKCAFATNINTLKDIDNPFITNVKNIFYPKQWKIIAALLLPPFMLKIMNIKSVFDENSNQFFFNLIRVLLNKRMTYNENHNDFLQLLMNASKNLDTVHNLDPDDEEIHHCFEGYFNAFIYLESLILICFTLSVLRLSNNS